MDQSAALIRWYSISLSVLLLYIPGDDWYEQSYDIEHFTDNWAQFCVVKDTSPIFKVYISEFSDEL